MRRLWKKIPMGTRSLLCGAHTWWIHPWFVAASWIRLYGWPDHPAIWASFLLHDIGYAGLPEMDGEQGERHVFRGAELLHRWFDRPVEESLTLDVEDKERIAQAEAEGWRYAGYGPGSTIYFRRTRNHDWYEFSLYHSRYWAKKAGKNPSRLCVADKYAICLTPWWIYCPSVLLTGEIHEYMALSKAREAANERLSDEERTGLRGNDVRLWYRGLQDYMRRWVKAHKEDQADTWTARLSS